MDSPLLIALFLSNLKYIVPLVLFTWYISNTYITYRRLSHIPGPHLAKWSSLWLVRAVWRKQSHLEFFEAAKKYGSLVRIGPNMLLTTNTELLRRMSAARSPYTRSDWYLAFQLLPGVDNVFSMLDDKAHTRRRAQMSNGYLGKENITLEPTIDRNIGNFINLIRTKYLTSRAEVRPMDFAEKAQFFTLDTILDIATGTPMGDLDQDADVNAYLKTTSDFVPPLVMVGSVPSVQNFLHIPFIAKKIFPTAEDKIGVGRLIAIAQEKVAERFRADPSTKVEKEDMLQSFIRHGLSEAEAVSESLIQVLGGSDTSSGAIRSIMLYIITTSRVYTTLQREIDTASQQNRLSSPIVQDSEARLLPYLQAVIKEGMRIHPPATGLVAKRVPLEGDEIDGVKLPPGTKIGVNMWALLRDAKVFGNDAENFRPERWLEATGEKLKEMERQQELVWGYGKYVCIGRSVALIELNKIFVELLRNFDWALVDPFHPCKEACYAIFVMTDMWVTITERHIKN